MENYGGRPQTEGLEDGRMSSAKPRNPFEKNRISPHENKKKVDFMFDATASDIWQVGQDVVKTQSNPVQPIKTQSNPVKPSQT